MAVKGNQKPTSIPMHKEMAANGPAVKGGGAGQKPPFGKKGK